jgi:type II secretory pathway component GspD/PulD (secretin)
MSSSIAVETWSQFESTINSMVSSNSKIVVSPSDGTITLTATPTDIKRVAKYINEQNARLSRQVAISVKIMQVSLTDSDTYGLNLKAAFDDGDLISRVVTETHAGIDSSLGSLTWGIARDYLKLDAAIEALSKKNRASLIL